MTAAKPYRTFRYLQRMAATAGLTIHRYRPGPRQTKYRLFDRRQKADDFFCGGSLMQTGRVPEVSGFISGWIAATNKETFK